MNDSSRTSDATLIQNVMDGNLAAFHELVSRYESRVAGVVIGMLGRCAEAEDVGQEVFIRFYKNIKQFRGESSLGTYLTRIAINLSLNELKRRKRRQQRAASLDDAVHIADDSQSNKDDDRQCEIQAAIKKLPPKYQAVVTLRLVEGYSTKETAEILKLPEGTVLSRLSRAVEKLKKALTHMGNMT